MANHHRSRRSVSAMAAFLTPAGTMAKGVAVVTTLLVAFNCLAQDQPQTAAPDTQTTPPSAAATQPATVTIPAGTRLALVLTHPIQSRYIHRGDDIYAQITSPVTSGNGVVIPPGTFVDGKVDKLARRGGRGELHLQSMSITFPDGYVAPVSGPVVLESVDGYALKDPGQGRINGAFAMPMAGAGLGALIGHSVASSQNGTITNTLPPGCTGPPPGCLSSSLTIPPDKAKSTVIGVAVGGAIGVLASLVLLTNAHHFFLDVGTPVDMVLEQPLSLPQDEVAAAVRESEQSPVREQPIAPRPMPLPPSRTPTTARAIHRTFDDPE